MMCEHCRCIVTSKEAFEADFIVSDGNTSCVKCAEHNAAQAVTPDYCWAITRDLLDGTEKGVRGPDRKSVV